MRKYGNKQIHTNEGKFDSLFEYRYWELLKERQNKGEISDLRRQVEYELIPRQMKPVKALKRGKETIIERVAERPVKYIADFVYIDNGEEVIVDTKGFKTAEYIIKRKLMRYKGHPITEVSEKSEKERIRKSVLARMRK